MQLYKMSQEVFDSNPVFASTFFKKVMSLCLHLIVAIRINGCNLSGHQTIAQLGKGPIAQWYILYFMHAQYN